jgi:hypothetical protein
MAQAVAAVLAAAPSLSVDDLDSGEDELTPGMLEMNQRFQAAVLKTMDNQLAVMEDQVLDRQAKLDLAQRAREDLGVHLAEVQKEVPRLQRSLQRSQTENEKLVLQLREASIERDALKKELRVFTDDSSKREVHTRTIQTNC